MAPQHQTTTVAVDDVLPLVSLADRTLREMPVYTTTCLRDTTSQPHICFLIAYTREWLLQPV